MDMIQALTSINKSKVNLMRDESGDIIEAEVKGYPAFPVMRSLSYHKDIILLVNMLNEQGLQSFGITPQQHYEFLLNVIPKGNRFAKWAKTSKEVDIDLVCSLFSVSYQKAADIVSLLPESEMAAIRKATGGEGKRTK